MQQNHSHELVIANPRRIRPLWLRLLVWIISCVVVWATTAGLAITFIYFVVKDDIPQLPRLDQYNPMGTTRVYSQQGILLAEFAIERRDVVPASKIPVQVVKAFIASEDDNFFSHRGIDIMGILRAALKNIKAGYIVQGGSTITQQLAKSFVGREKTFSRKFKEMVFASQLEKTFRKKDILWLYLNQIYLGHGSYGVQAASQNYFHKNIWDLNLSEIATLAGLPQAPSNYDPVTKPASALKRRKYVLTRMKEVGFITEQQVKDASKAHIQIYAIPNLFRLRSPYFTEQVRREVQQRWGTEAVYEAGLSVETGVDVDWQYAAQQAMNRGLRQIDRRQGYRGVLTNISNPFERKKFLRHLQQNLGPNSITKGNTVLALVEEVNDKLAKLSIGNTRAYLPVMGLRWARMPNPTVHFETYAARVNDVRDVLKPGDVILVQQTDFNWLMKGEDPSLAKILPKNSVVVKLEQIPAVQGALVSVEPRLGYVKAIIGGYNFQDSEFNRVLQACRQPGSAFKPIQYSLGIEKNNYTPSTIIIDSAIVYDDPEQQSRWKPENYGADFKGKVTVHTALTKSMNVPAIKVMADVGVKETIDWAHKLGITTPMRAELGLALGASCVKPWDLLRVFTTFNLGGVKPELHFIRKVTDRFGRVLLNNTSYMDPWQTWDEKFDRAYDRLVTPSERLISPEGNYIITHLLKGAATRGTGAHSQVLGKPVAGKTGTTNESADAWFIGFTHDVVTTVWVGHDQPKDPLTRGETGSRAALPIWVDFMKQALGPRPQAKFDVPPNIRFVRIDPTTGLRARKHTHGSVLEAFHVDNQPEEYVLESDVAPPGQFFKVDQLY